MREGDKRIFSNPKALAEMLEMHKSGANKNELGRHFKVDHSSIIYQINKSKGIRRKTKMKNLDTRIRLIRGHCPECQMLLTAPYHIDNPCQQ